MKNLEKRVLPGLLSLIILVECGFAATVDVYKMTKSTTSGSGGFSTTTWGSSLGTVEANAPVYLVDGDQTLYTNGGTAVATFPNGTLYIGYSYDSGALAPSATLGGFRVQSSLNADVMLGNSSMYMAYNGLLNTTFQLQGTLTVADNTQATLSANSQGKRWEVSSVIKGSATSTITVNSTTDSSYNTSYIKLLTANNPFAGTWIVKGPAPSIKGTLLLANASNTLGTTSSVIINAGARLQNNAFQTIKNLTINSGTYETQGVGLTVSGTTSFTGKGSITATGGNQTLGTVVVSGTQNLISASNLYLNNVTLNAGSSLYVNSGVLRTGGATFSVADNAKLYWGYNTDGTASETTTVLALSNGTFTRTVENLYLGNVRVINSQGDGTTQTTQTVNGSIFVGKTAYLQAASNNAEKKRLLVIGADIASESNSAKGTLYLRTYGAEDSKVVLSGDNHLFKGDMHIGDPTVVGTAEATSDNSLGSGDLTIHAGSALTSKGEQNVASLTMETGSVLDIQKGMFTVEGEFLRAESTLKLQIDNDNATMLTLNTENIPDFAIELYTNEENLDVSKVYSFLTTGDSAFSNFILSPSLLDAGMTAEYADGVFQLRKALPTPEPATWMLMLLGGMMVFHSRKKMG